MSEYKKMTIFDSSMYLIDHEISSETHKIIYDEFERKAKSLNNKSFYMPNSNKDSFIIANKIKHLNFDLQRFLFFQKDCVTCKTLRRQLLYFLNYTEKEKTHIKTLKDLLYQKVRETHSKNRDMEEKSSETNCEKENKESEIEKIMETEEINRKYKSLIESSKETQAILAIVRRKEHNLKIIQEIKNNMAKVINTGQDTALEIKKLCEIEKEHK